MEYQVWSRKNEQEPWLPGRRMSWAQTWVYANALQEAGWQWKIRRVPQKKGEGCLMKCALCGRKALKSKLLITTAGYICRECYQRQETPVLADPETLSHAWRNVTLRTQTGKTCFVETNQGDDEILQMHPGCVIVESQAD